MRDAAAFRHAVEQGRAAIVALQHQMTEAKERVMHIMRRVGRGDTVDKGFGHISCIS